MKEDRKALQELYKFDFSGPLGDQNMIYYAELRALGHTHETALEMVEERHRKAYPSWPNPGWKDDL